MRQHPNQPPPISRRTDGFSKTCGAGEFWIVLPAPNLHESQRNRGAGKFVGVSLPAPGTSRPGSHSRLPSTGTRGMQPVKTGIRPGDNEQLEFFGDAEVARARDRGRTFSPLSKVSGKSELSKLRAHLVSERPVIQVAQNLSLGNYLRLAGERKERRWKTRRPCWWTHLKPSHCPVSGRGPGNSAGVHL